MIKREKLYILPFDHRTSFVKMFGFKESDLPAAKILLLSDYKHLIFEGFLGALELGVSREAAAILVDEQFGEKIQREAQKLGLIRLLPLEKSGQEEFDFEYGNEFGQHLEKFKPDYAKVLVRYNPQGDRELNRRQREKLKILSEFCQKEGFEFLFELLVPATGEQLGKVGGEDEYEKRTRGELMAQAIKELQEAGVEPDVWKIEGLAEVGQMREVVNQTKAGGRTGVGVVVLGRGEEEEKVERWLKVAAKIPGVIGISVGRTVFAKAILAYHARKILRSEAAQEIAQKYKEFVDLFEKAKNS